MKVYTQLIVALLFLLPIHGAVARAQCPERTLKLNRMLLESPTQSQAQSVLTRSKNARDFLSKNRPELLPEFDAWVHALSQRDPAALRKLQGIEGAHAVGVRGNGAYTPAEIAEKTRILEAFGLSKRERELAISSGWSGEEYRMRMAMTYLGATVGEKMMAIDVNPFEFDLLQRKIVQEFKRDQKMRALAGDIPDEIGHWTHRYERALTAIWRGKYPEIDLDELLSANDGKLRKQLISGEILIQPKPPKQISVHKTAPLPEHLDDVPGLNPKRIPRINTLLEVYNVPHAPFLVELREHLHWLEGTFQPLVPSGKGPYAQFMKQLPENYKLWPPEIRDPTTIVRIRKWRAENAVYEAGLAQVRERIRAGTMKWPATLDEDPLVFSFKQILDRSDRTRAQHRDIANWESSAPPARR